MLLALAHSFKKNYQLFPNITLISKTFRENFITLLPKWNCTLVPDGGSRPRMHDGNGMGVPAEGRRNFLGFFCAPQARNILSGVAGSKKLEWGFFTNKGDFAHACKSRIKQQPYSTAIRIHAISVISLQWRSSAPTSEVQSPTPT